MSSFKLLLIGLLVTILVYVLTYLWRHRRYYYLGLAIPGPPALPVFGNSLSFVGSSLDHISSTLTRIYEENRHHHPVFRLWLGTSLAVFPTDPDLIRHILVHNLHKAPCYHMLSGSSGQGLIQHRHIPKWKKHRKIVGTSFRFSVLKSHIRIFFEEATILADKLSPLALSKEPFEPHHLVGLAALNALMRSSFEVDFEIQQNHHSHHPYLEAVESNFQIFLMRTFQPWLMIDFFNGLFGVKTQIRKNRNVQRSFIGKILDHMKDKITNEKKSVREFDDGLSMTGSFVERALRDQTNPLKDSSHCLTDTELLHEMVSLLNAGSDTVTITISVVLNILAIHPHLQQDVYNEIELVLGTCDTSPTYDQLQDLNLLTRVVQEAMRLYPPAPVIGRSSPDNIECGHVTIPAGAAIGIFIYGIHRDPRYWPDPDRFDPDRFLPSEVAKRNPNAYLPFSLGARNCIGTKYAMLQMKSTISTLLRRYRVLPGDKCRSLQDIRFEFGITMRPLPGNDVRVESR